MALKSKKKVRAVFLIVYFVFIALLIEFSLRGFYAVQYKQSDIIISPTNILFAYYPKLREVRDAEIFENNDQLDILLLGASVLHEEFGNFEEVLLKSLQLRTSSNVKIYNISKPAHTSQDSKIKFEMLSDKHFDAVVLYHSINEISFNHCRSEEFKLDYSHVEYYNQLNAIVNIPLSSFSILPFFYHAISDKLAEHFGWKSYLPMGASRDGKWPNFDGKIRTTESLKNNYTHIIEQTILKDIPIILPTYNYYIDTLYSLSAFSNKELDYQDHTCPIELWGNVATVKLGLEAHEKVMEELQAKYASTSSVSFPPKFSPNLNNREYFNDVCHLTNLGCSHLVKDIVLDPILKLCEKP